MIIDKVNGHPVPRYLIYDIIKFNVSSLWVIILERKYLMLWLLSCWPVASEDPLHQGNTPNKQFFFLCDTLRDSQSSRFTASPCFLLNKHLHRLGSARFYSAAVEQQSGFEARGRRGSCLSVESGDVKLEWSKIFCCSRRRSRAQQHLCWDDSSHHTVPARLAGPDSSPVTHQVFPEVWPPPDARRVLTVNLCWHFHASVIQQTSKSCQE